LKKYFATKRKLFKGHHSDALFRLPTKLQGEPHHHMFCKFSTETPKTFFFQKKTPKTLALGTTKTVMFPGCLHTYTST